MIKTADQAPNGNTHPKNEATLEPSGIGAKCKAHSLSSDEEDGDDHEHDHDHLPIPQNEQPSMNNVSRLGADRGAGTGLHDWMETMTTFFDKKARGTCQNIVDPSTNTQPVQLGEYISNPLK